MDLVVFTLENYRRFKKRTSVKLYGGMIAIVGPNEAGKTSLLKAMTHLNDERVYERSEMTRRGGVQPTLSWQLQLDDTDKSKLAGIYGTEDIEKVTITKGPSGSHEWAFHPKDPVRDRREREDCLPQFDFLRSLGSEWAMDSESGAIDGEVLDAAEALLKADVENFTEDQVAVFNAASETLKQAAQARLDVDEGEPSEDDLEYAGSLNGVADSLDDVYTAESKDSPRLLAESALRASLPRIELFEQKHRELDPYYDLNEHADSPPAALRHLAALAGLDLIALRDEVNAGLDADVSTRKKRANKKLQAVFDANWHQKEIAVQFEVKGAELLIQATTPDDDGFSSIDERSDGMRWFAALLAFTYNWEGQPILLADEIETHLHYDAQSDLVDVLSAQEFTAKVIYTTHSFGCLPHDLGNGVRAVKHIDNATSELTNSFWNDGAGFSPLLAVMGAAAVSFTPSRRAVVGEGPGEAILLPTLLRQASGMSKLDFQVVPGIAIVAAVGVSDLETEAGRLAFIVDGDPGGLANKDKLTDGGIGSDRIVVLTLDDGSPIELEDLVDAGIYASAVNAEIRLWNKSLQKDLTVADLTPTMVTKSVEAWCAANGIKSPDKAAVAQRVVDAANTSRTTPVDVYASAHKDLLNRILHRFEETLDSYASGN